MKIFYVTQWGNPMGYPAKAKQTMILDIIVHLDDKHILSIFGCKEGNEW